MSEIINPRALLAEKDGKQKLYRLLSDAGYVPQQQPLNAMCNAITMATPILLEGHRGGGKTAFPEALAKALGLRLFTLPGLPDTTTDHILSSWDSAAQKHYVGMEMLNQTPFAEAMEKQWTLDFLKLGEVLDGFHYSATTREPCVILLDEVDKTSSDAESALLQILGRGYANVPKLRPDGRLGFVPEMAAEARALAYPIVVLTSNDMRPLSPPLLSRARYCFIPSPTIEETVRILNAAVPEVLPLVLYQTSKLINGISGLPLLDKPALREFIMLLETFVKKKHKHLTAEIIGENIDCLAKNRKDTMAVADAVDLLFYNYVNKDDPGLESLVRQIVQNSRSPVSSAAR